MPSRRGRRQGRRSKRSYYQKEEENEEYDRGHYDQSKTQSEITVLMVAEKPSIANTISHILGGPSVKQYRGKSRISPIFEYYGQFKGYPALFKVTSVAGHVFERDFPKKYKPWNSCEPRELFDIETVQIDDNKHNFNITSHLRSVAPTIDALVCWLDCDREGENICFEVIKVLKDQLNGEIYDTVFRAKFSSLADVDIKNAFNNLTERPN